MVSLVHYGLFDPLQPIRSIKVNMVHNSWTNGPLEDYKISTALSWQGLPSDDKIIDWR